MLQVTIPDTEYWDEVNNQFVYTKGLVLTLEHSLVSLAKWESKWCKPFLNQNGKEKKTTEETLDYIRCMTITQNVDQKVYERLTDENIREINQYIEAPMTAAWFSKESQKRGPAREQITAELIYYWMIALNIPFECQKWHLNRLLTLIKVCNIKNQPPKKRGTKEIMKRNSAINAARRKKFNTRG